MPPGIPGRGRAFWLSLGLGVLAGLAVLPSFTDPLLSSIGGFVFVVGVVSLLVRGSIALGQAFVRGWREPPRPVAR
jgi:hypothetical protein